jgi:hypothetical protein
MRIIIPTKGRADVIGKKAIHLGVQARPFPTSWAVGAQRETALAPAPTRFLDI